MKLQFDKITGIFIMLRLCATVISKHEQISDMYTGQYSDKSKYSQDI